MTHTKIRSSNVEFQTTDDNNNVNLKVHMNTNTKQSFVAASLIVLISASIALAADWYFYSPVDNSFQISFPEKPKVSSSEHPGEYGAMTVHVASLRKPGSSNVVTYDVTYSDYPAGTISSRAPSVAKNALDGAIEGLNTSGRVRLRSTENADFNSYPGRLSYFENVGNSDVIIIRNILVENRLYALQVQVKAGMENHKNVDRFFNSFVLF